MKRAILCTALLLALVFGAYAEGDEDLYILNYAGEDVGGYAYGQRFMHPSPHYNYLLVDEDGDGVNEARWNYTGHKTMNMIHTGLIASGGEGAYASIPVYCLDAVTDGLRGHYYRRVNLEESAYFDDETARRLRALLLNVFPYETDMAALQSRVNAWIRQSGRTDLAPAEALTETECITAAQSCIWVLTNGVAIQDPYLGTAAARFSADDCVYPEYLNQSASEHTGGNIAALCEYLLALEPAQPLDPLISPESFGQAQAVYARGADGTYTLTITASVTAHVHDGTALTLTASCGERLSQPVHVQDGTHVYTLTLSGVSALEEILLTLEGEQYAEDVFLFDPVDGAAASQTMGFFTAASTPVRVRMTVEDVQEQTGSLVIRKQLRGDAADAAQRFRFVVELDDRSISGIYGDMTFANGRAEARLAGGESASATGLPCGVGYTVREDFAPGYEVHAQGDRGTITAQGAQAVFVNSRYAAVPGAQEDPDGGADVPATGDEAHPALWAALLILSAAGMRRLRRA